MAKHRDFDREAVVYVWTYKNPGHPGHAAIKLSGLPGIDPYASDPQRRSKSTYISWWPGGDGAGLLNAFEKLKGIRNVHYKQDMSLEMGMKTRIKLESGQYQPRNKQRRIYRQTQNEFEWAMDADYKVRLPGMGAAGVAFGLDLGNMYEWWEIFRSSPHPEYKFASKNGSCAGVVIQALKAGGASNWVKAPKNSVFATPNDVERWATKLRAKLDEENDHVEDFNQTLTNTGQQNIEPVKELMTRDEWLGLSVQDVQTNHRSKLVRAMDSLVYEYHALDWDTMAFEKLVVLGEILTVTQKYLKKKPNDPRSAAVMTLGGQAMKVARRHLYLHTDNRIHSYKSLEWLRKDPSLS